MLNWLTRYGTDAASYLDVEISPVEAVA